MGYVMMICEVLSSILHTDLNSFAGHTLASVPGLDSDIDSPVRSAPKVTSILVGTLIYATVLHFLYWARNRSTRVRSVVDFLGKITRQGEGVVLIWAIIADFFAIWAIIFWWRGR